MKERRKFDGVSLNQGRRFHGTNMNDKEANLEYLIMSLHAYIIGFYGLDLRYGSP